MATSYEMDAAYGLLDDDLGPFEGYDLMEEQAMYEDADGRMAFKDPGGRSALRAASRSNPRNLPCPNCGDENVLTPADRAKGYQCDRCADAAEGAW